MPYGVLSGEGVNFVYEYIYNAVSLLGKYIGLFVCYLKIDNVGMHIYIYVLYIYTVLPQITASFV